MFQYATHRTALTLAILAAWESAATAQQRTWTDSSGKFSVEAALAEAKQESVVLKKSSGKLITVPVARLSETDRQYLEALAQEPQREPVPPSPEVIAAWRKAGAEFGWISQRDDLAFASQGRKPVTGDVPAFRFRQFPTGKLENLPPPEVAFGLWFSRSATDAELEELVGLRQLRSLCLGHDYGRASQVTDAGLKVLTVMTQLQSLELGDTKVTDTGVQELRNVVPGIRVFR